MTGFGIDHLLTSIDDLRVIGLSSMANHSVWVFVINWLSTHLGVLRVFQTKDVFTELRIDQFVAIFVYYYYWGHVFVFCFMKMIISRLNPNL